MLAVALRKLQLQRDTTDNTADKKLVEHLQEKSGFCKLRQRLRQCVRPRIALLLKFCQLLSHLQQQGNVFLSVLSNILLNFLVVLELLLNSILKQIELLVLRRLLGGYYLQVIF